MRHPRRARTIALVAVVLGAGLIAVAAKLPAAWAGDLPRALLGSTGACGVMFGAVFGWMAHRAARAQAALERGDTVLARWRVEAADWRAFLEADRATGDAGLPNELSAPDEPANGIEVVVGEDAIDIGGSIHVLPRHGAPEVLEATLREGGGTGPDIAELRLRHPPQPRRNGGMSPALLTRLTFPVGRGAWRDARRAIGHYTLGRPGRASFFHGRGDGSDPEDLSTCATCGHQTHQFRATCPQCGGVMLSRRWARRFGGVVAVLGAGITITMTVLLLRLSPMLAHPGADYGGTRFSGTPTQALMVWAVLAAVWVFGATATIYGTWQVATGRRNLRVAYLMLGIFSALVVVARWL